MIAYGIALWGAYICWEAEKDEKKVKVALKKYRKKKKKEMVSKYDYGKIYYGCW